MDQVNFPAGDTSGNLAYFWEKLKDLPPNKAWGLYARVLGAASVWVPSSEWKNIVDRGFLRETEAPK